jgi:hypothetical protein
MRRHLVPIAALGLAAAGLPVLADPTGSAILNSVAFQPFAASLPINVRVLDNSEENLALQGELEKALVGRGYVVGPEGSPLVLTIDTGDAVGAWQSPSDSSRVRVRDDRGRLFPNGELDMTRQLQLPLPRTTVVTPAQFRLSLTLDQRPVGGRVWQGWAIADLSQGNPAELGQAMVPKLVASLGQTVRQQSFELQ